MTGEGDSLGPEMLLRAYAAGIFPMAESRDNPELFWVDPRQRGVLPLDAFHISRSLARRIRQARYSISLDTAFDTVVDACADREETWINDEIRALYSALHLDGHAHSLEVWEEDGALAGGVYGVALGGAFFGESMFSNHTDGSKRALAHLVAHLRRCGFVLFDTQFLTPHLARLGAIEISRERYRKELALALQVPAQIDAHRLLQPPHPVVQRKTQIS
ncbi:leucyl/phenylalanyl-tRNA--protein transferase [Roseovarius aestuariivivens]|uniref:leucyl/phenylalanyl-tRNA--protein transferase n=1 Tax=Roseovarius aestuariivivens TaxID=1888910 RepID=UPI001080C09A|nr:leucyl/phenylalanyl-tRNA--protein transferase [Roseovarius aestuariivivens]